MGLGGGLVCLVLVLNSYTVSAVPAVQCSDNDLLQFVKDDVDICGYYLCNGGAFQADPASGNMYMPCAPGASTRIASGRSLFTPCTSFDASCTGVVPIVPYDDTGSDSNAGNHGNNGWDRTTTQAPPTSGYPVTSGPNSGSTHPPTFSRPVAVFTNAHVDGGRHLVAIRIDQGPVMAVTSRRLCHSACDLNVTCTAFDWDEARAACWIHTELTACGQLLQKTGCEHVRLVKCGAVPTIPPRYSGSSSTSKYQPAPTTTMTPGGPPQDIPIEGFVERFVDAHVKEGRLILTKATRAACLAYCAHFSKCEAVDFDRYSETCWLHEANTACGNLVSKVGCTHYKRVSCSANDLAPMFLVSFREVHVAGGAPLCDGCTLTQCQHQCLHEPKCAAADYNSLEARCYGHLAETACNKLQTKQGCTHFRRVPCYN